MRFDKCPTCDGKLVGWVDSEGNWFANTHGDVPCPTCQDSEGKPTGRVAILSLEDLGDLNTACYEMALSNPREEEAWESMAREFIDERIHRSNPGKGGS
jgi:hypothetical protein